ncbi:MAG: hypothetical protein HYT37_01455 [Candidatus Sungbacteria bacterium]|nr:hypothetical protein [Candidatus Sungbacteria bacterium]
MRPRKKKITTECSPQETWLIVAGAFLIAAGVISYMQKSFSNEISSNNASLENMVIPRDQRIWIVFDSGTDMRKFEGVAAQPPRSLAEELEALAKDTGTPLRVQNDMLVEFDRTKNKTKQWQLYKGEEGVAGPLSRFIVSRGDHYVFKYE